MKNISKYNSSTSNFLSISGASAKPKSRRKWCTCWLDTALFWKSLGEMVRISIKLGDQTNETEYLNLAHKTGIQQKVSTKVFCHSISIFLLPHFFGLANQTWLRFSLVDLIEDR